MRRRNLRLDTHYNFNERQKQMGRHGYISTYDYELDSGSYFFRLMYSFWQSVGERAVPVCLFTYL